MLKKRIMTGAIGLSIASAGAARGQTHQHGGSDNQRERYVVHFIYHPGSDLYIVYNDLQQTGLPPNTFAPSDRQFVVKMNYLLAR